MNKNYYLEKYEANMKFFKNASIFSLKTSLYFFINMSLLDNKITLVKCKKGYFVRKQIFDLNNSKLFD